VRRDKHARSDLAYLDQGDLLSERKKSYNL